ncbi:MAG: hypothetical protein DMF92_01270 [Acidobacteria bacterium]|nr:MAG: hypothetical protein DMF92_01270 [Acidobacteriota bacterium]
MRSRCRGVEIDRVPHETDATDGDEARLKERERKTVRPGRPDVWVVRNAAVRRPAVPDVEVIGHDEPAVLVVFNLRAALAHEGFDLDLIEPATGEHHPRRGHAGPVRLETRNDAVDVGFDVDAGFVLKLALPVFLLLHRHCMPQMLPELRRHHLAYVGISDD